MRRHTEASLAAAVLALTGCAGVTATQPADDDTAGSEVSDGGGSIGDGGAVGDGGGGGDGGGVGDGGGGGDDPPVVDLLNPGPSPSLFAGTRYDVLASVLNADSVATTADGFPLDCRPLNGDGFLACDWTPASAGTHHIEVSAARGDASATAAVTVEVTSSSAVIPAGDRFALGMYEVMDEAWFEPLANAGFPLAQSYGTGAYSQDTWQQWAADWDMQTLARTSWSWSDPWGEPYSDDELTALATLPQIAWWELPDNAVGDDSYADEVAALAARIREVDDRPIFMYLWTSTSTEDIGAYLPSLDVVEVGAYPEHACQPQSWIRWRIETAVQAVQDAGYTTAEKPVVGTADLYGQPDSGCIAAELPQVRMNPLAMMASGASGVMYFAWYYAVHSLDPTWGESALSTAELITGDSGIGEAVIHGTPLGDQDVQILSGPELGDAFTPYGLTETFQYPSIQATAWDWAGTRYAIAVNYADRAVEARLTSYSTAFLAVEVVGEDRSLVPSDDGITDTFAAWGAHVYRAPITRSE